MIPVLDASTVIKSALDEALEPGARAARRAIAALMERGAVVAPGLMAWEVGHVAHVKHPRRFGADLRERQALVRSLLVGIELIQPDDPTLARVGQIAEARALTFYDAAYLELATREPEALLITEDGRLRRAGEQELGAGRCMDAATAWTRVEADEL